MLLIKIMKQKDSVPTNAKKDIEKKKTVNDIKDVNNLATKSTQKLELDQKDLIEENPQKSTKSGLTVIIIIILSMYGATILFCFAIIGFGIAAAERREILTLIITSQATLIGSAIGFYFGKNQ